MAKRNLRRRIKRQTPRQDNNDNDKRSAWRTVFSENLPLVAKVVASLAIIALSLMGHPPPPSLS